MTSPLVAYLAAEYAATHGLSARAEAASELLEVVHAAQCGQAWAIEWIESPAWEVLHTVIGEGERAEVRRREILGRILAEAGAPTYAEVEAELDRFRVAWEAHRTVGGVARACGVSWRTARARIACVINGTQPRGVGRPRQQEAA